MSWTFSIQPEEGDELEDQYEVTLLAKKKAYMAAAIVDVQDWAALEVYLRDKFEVKASVTRISLAVKVELDGEVKLRKKNVCDVTTLGTVHFNIIDLGKLLLDATVVKVTASLTSMTLGKKLKAKAKERTRNQEEAGAKWNELKKSIYGSTAGTKSNSYTTGQWTTEASDIMRREHAYMEKQARQRLTPHGTPCQSSHTMGSHRLTPLGPCQVLRDAQTVREGAGLRRLPPSPVRAHLPHCGV